MISCGEMLMFFYFIGLGAGILLGEAFRQNKRGRPE